jgi:hypothetical protein
MTTQASTIIPESKIQSTCFMHHWNTYPQERGQLFMVYNTPKNAAHGSILKAMGMVAGCSDLILLRRRHVIFLECKKPGGVQSPEQKRFETLVRSLGFDYELFHSLPEFVAILERYP